MLKYLGHVGQSHVFGFPADFNQVGGFERGLVKAGKGLPR